MAMKNDADRYRRVSHLVLSALTGQTRVSVTLAAYAVLAVVLLGYVTAQVYARVLAQEIRVLKQERSVQQEELNKLTSRYIALSSRTSVTDYCEQELGMKSARVGTMEHFAVGDGLIAPPVEITESVAPLPHPYRYSMNRKKSSESLP